MLSHYLIPEQKEAQIPYSFSFLWPLTTTNQLPVCPGLPKIHILAMNQNFTSIYARAVFCFLSSAQLVYSFIDT
jgi:hypothetical protein